MKKKSWTHTSYSQQFVFGLDSLARLPDIVESLGLRRVMLVTTATRAGSEHGQRIVRLLGRRRASTFAEVRSHVPSATVGAALRQARRDDIDSVVSFGGGSCADLGKAVCFFTEQEADGPTSSSHHRPPTVHVAIPTTYSGAEATPAFGMTDEHTGVKSGRGAATIAPVAVIYDPLLTLDVPVSVSAATAMNALAHCIEGAYSPTRTPEAEAVLLAAARRIVDAAPRVIEQPADLDARSDLLTGAAMSARCQTNAPTGVHHGLCHLVGGRTGVAHGLVNAVILPHAMRFVAPTVPDVMARLSATFGTDLDAADFVTRLLTRLRLPTRLSECGVTEPDIVAAASGASASPNVQRNVCPVTEADALRILHAAY